MLDRLSVVGRPVRRPSHRSAAMARRTIRRESVSPLALRASDSSSKPAFAIRWRTNARASGRWRQTLGRNRARRLPAERMSPSRSGSSAAASSDSLPAGIGRGWERIETSRRSPVSSDSFSGGKRGSAKAACAVLATRIVDERPTRLERTDAAAKPFVFGQGDEGRAPRRKRGRPVVEASAAAPCRRSASPVPRAAMQAESRRSRSASASRAEAAYSSAKAP